MHFTFYHLLTSVMRLTGLRSAPTFTLNATKEVILSAGAVNTPQLLLLSGIGPPAALRALGIAPLVDHPHVGQHLSDHPRISNQFAAARLEFDVLEAIGRNQTLLNALVEEWREQRTGFVANGGSNHVGWFRVPVSDTSGKDDPSSGQTSPHYEILFRVRPPPALSF